MKTQWHPHSQLYSPPTPISIYSPCQHTSKCAKRVRLNSFCVCVTFLALRIHEIATSLTFSAMGSSYPTFDLFPVPAHLQTQEMSSFELVSCLHNIPSPTDTQRLDGTHTLCYTPLLLKSVIKHFIFSVYFNKYTFLHLILLITFDRVHISQKA